jgi:hypothetical protein
VGSFEDAKLCAQQNGKWLLVNIVDANIFDSFALNRDVWNVGDVEVAIAAHTYTNIHTLSLHRTSTQKCNALRRTLTHGYSNSHNPRVLRSNLRSFTFCFIVITRRAPTLTFTASLRIRTNIAGRRARLFRLVAK